MQVTIVKLLAIELFSAGFVYDVPVSSLHKPTKPIHSAALFIDIESLLGLEKLGNCTTCARIILELKVSHQVVRVEVKLLNTERCRNFTFFVNFLSTKQLCFRVVLQDIPGLGVCQVTANVRWMASLVAIVAMTILENNNVTTIVSVKLSQDIIDVESSVISVRRNLDRVSLLVKVLNQLLRHHNFMFQLFIIFIRSLFRLCNLIYNIVCTLDAI